MLPFWFQDQCKRLKQKSGPSVVFIHRMWTSEAKLPSKLMPELVSELFGLQGHFRGQSLCLKSHKAQAKMIDFCPRKALLNEIVFLLPQHFDSFMVSICDTKWNNCFGIPERDGNILRLDNSLQFTRSCSELHWE